MGKSKSIKVSSEMASEGLRVFEELENSCPGYLLVVEIYTAMELVRRHQSRAMAGTDRYVVQNAHSDDE
jgi:hypothetical protein